VSRNQKRVSEKQRSVSTKEASVSRKKLSVSRKKLSVSRKKDLDTKSDVLEHLVGDPVLCFRRERPHRPLHMVDGLQGYLAHKKQPPPPVDAHG